MSEYKGFLPAKSSKLTPSVKKAILKVVRQGATLEMAAQAAGLTAKTLFNWRQKAELGEQPYLEFWETVEVAKTEHLSKCLAVIDAALDANDVQTAKWALERHHTSPFYRKHEATITVNAGKQIPDYSNLSEDELEVEERKLEAELKGRWRNKEIDISDQNVNG